jgi:hypothetical protein
MSPDMETHKLITLDRWKGDSNGVLTLNMHELIYEIPTAVLLKIKVFWDVTHGSW